MESNPRLDRLRQQAGDLAENMGTQWADYVAAVINQWTDGEEQGLYVVRAFRTVGLAI